MPAQLTGILSLAVLAYRREYQQYLHDAVATVLFGEARHRTGGLASSAATDAAAGGADGEQGAAAMPGSWQSLPSSPRRGSRRSSLVPGLQHQQQHGLTAAGAPLVGGAAAADAVPLEAAVAAAGAGGVGAPGPTAAQLPSHSRAVSQEELAAEQSGDWQVLFHEQQLDCQLALEDPSPGMPWGRAKFQARQCGAGQTGWLGLDGSQRPTREVKGVEQCMRSLTLAPCCARSLLQIIAYYAPQFAELRRRCVVGGEQAFLASISRCRKWATRGGKSAAYFARSCDKRCAACLLLLQSAATLRLPCHPRPIHCVPRSFPSAVWRCRPPCFLYRAYPPQIHREAAVPQRAAVVSGVCPRLLPLRGHHAAPRPGHVPGQGTGCIPGAGGGGGRARVLPLFSCVFCLPGEM